MSPARFLLLPGKGPAQRSLSRAGTEQVSRLAMPKGTGQEEAKRSGGQSPSSKRGRKPWQEALWVTRTFSASPLGPPLLVLHCLQGVICIFALHVKDPLVPCCPHLVLLLRWDARPGEIPGWTQLLLPSPSTTSCTLCGFLRSTWGGKTGSRDSGAAQRQLPFIPCHKRPVTPVSSILSLLKPLGSSLSGTRVRGPGWHVPVPSPLTLLPPPEYLSSLSLELPGFLLCHPLLTPSFPLLWTSPFCPTPLSALSSVGAPYHWVFLSLSSCEHGVSISGWGFRGPPNHELYLGFVFSDQSCAWNFWF